MINKKSTQRNDPDKDLIDGIKAGNKALYTELVNRYKNRLYNFGMKICREPSDAEDLVQETFINVFKSLEGFRNEAKFKNWLYTIAARVCVKMRRKSKYAPDNEVSLDDIEQFLPDEQHQAKVSVWAQKPTENLMNKELGETIQAAIKKLPPKYKMVLVLRDIEGFTSDETARIMAISSANVKVRLHRARLFLRQELEALYA